MEQDPLGAARSAALHHGIEALAAKRETTILNKLVTDVNSNKHSYESLLAGIAQICACRSMVADAKSDARSMKWLVDQQEPGEKHAN